MRILYTFGIWMFQLLMQLAALFNQKAKLGIEGRKKTLSDLETLNPNVPRILMHCASLGEYEMGAPLLEKLKLEFPNYQFVISFFSPSGYEVVQPKSEDLVIYLPFDLPKKQKAFIDTLKPEIVIFVKYEYWYNLIDILHQKSIPQIFVSGIFNSKKIFFKWYGQWFLKQLKKIDFFFVQNPSSKQILNSNGLDNAIVAGDTRFDRVKETAEIKPNLPEMEAFKQDKKLIIGGSTWPKGDELFYHLLENHPDLDAKIVIAPHDINEEKITALTHTFVNLLGKEKVIKWMDEAGPNDFSNAKILIINNIGLLKKLYYYSDIAYIGGAFRHKGLHNLLEAAVFSNALIIGPHFKDFPEAVEMYQNGDIISIKNKKEFEESILSLLNNEKYLIDQQKKSKQYIFSKPISTEIIFEEIVRKNWLG